MIKDFFLCHTQEYNTQTNPNIKGNSLPGSFTLYTIISDPSTLILSGYSPGRLTV
ncbi:hypothetical protein [Chryseobacterium bernardetii]|uniref:hypothetical protein n=1 Tax=Chryseobacterium bernardetii TaxID=1241978 RepID=UPI0013DE74D3|nr:hypothetical protein [Chryseobacterium bernardetii]